MTTIDIESMIAPAAAASEYLKLMIYGEYGCGKTTLAAGAPKPLIVNCERGVTSLLKNPALRNTPTINVTTLGEFRALFDYLRANPGKYETLVIDTMTELQKIFLDGIIREESNNNKALDGYTVPVGGYNKNTQQIRALLANLLDVPLHIFVLCHVKEAEDDNKIVRKMPALTPAVAGGFMGLMDVVGYMVQKVDDITKETMRSIQTKWTPRVEAKNRLDLPDLMTNPTAVDFVSAFQRLRETNPTISLNI